MLCERSLGAERALIAVEDPLMAVSVHGLVNGPAALNGLMTRIATREAIVAVIGLGYVGLPLLTAAGNQGFGLIGVDADASKIQSLQEGRSYIADIEDEELLVLQ
ncbi:MAG: hypothetical protein M3P18_23465, partial [Actinomycetota bacterium]|nr:hypothetical protein [Actinomycetota bacterium]